MLFTFSGSYRVYLQDDGEGLQTSEGIFTGKFRVMPPGWIAQFGRASDL